MQDSKCEDCRSGCSTCIAYDKCTSCVQGLYFNPASMMCVNANACPGGSYPDPHTSSCAPCHSSCETCSGPATIHCRVCMMSRGLRKESNGLEGKCELITCPNGAYLALSENAHAHAGGVGISVEEPTCSKCHPACQICTGAKNSDCRTCSVGFQPEKSTTGDSVSCLTCSEQNPGLEDDGKGRCKGNSHLIIIVRRDLWGRSEFRTV